MSERAYDRLGNILMLIGIGSALVFDSGRFSHVAVGTIGILAGVAAVVLYFVNQRHVTEKQEEPAKAETKAVVENASAEAPKSKPEDIWAVVLGGNYEKDAIQLYRRSAHLHRLVMHQNEALYLNEALYGLYLVEATKKALPEMPLSPNDVAACAIEIIRHLSAGQERDRWEFRFGPEGLCVSAKKGSQERPTVPQSDFDFGQMSAMIQ